ncbi:hypothetical protein RCG23_13750 [Neobacillus sp. PS3-34]|uniref:hypothetical protein n=1 Tax=Neobacillus sp. PS3-34 TaxID=3070678 RepID=UPI0027E00D12|nr:hypothetical protein [Neobacillus sp. PS3-34]WML46708.1 hypothetical protein RCG23_13750 [Neobacillus sp. PS3-34]
MNIHFIWGLISGSLITILTKFLLEEPLTFLIKKIASILHIKIRSSRIKHNIHDQHYFRLGSKKTNFYVVEGNGLISYLKNGVNVVLDSEPILLPSEIQEICTNEYESVSRKAKWNGTLFTLQDYRIDRTHDENNMVIQLDFKKSNYYTFSTLNLNLDKSREELNSQTIRQTYLSMNDTSEVVEEVVPFLANGFGIAVLVFTKDNKFILSRRSMQCNARPGEYDVTIVESVNEKDIIGSNKMDLYNTVTRGIEEELGLSIQKEKVTFLGFGVDMDYYQWNMVGIVDLSKDYMSDEILNARSMGAEGKWENKEFIALSMKDLQRKVIDPGEMWGMGLVTLYWGLKYKNYINSKEDEDLLSTFF